MNPASQGIFQLNGKARTQGTASVVTPFHAERVSNRSKPTFAPHSTPKSSNDAKLERVMSVQPDGESHSIKDWIHEITKVWVRGTTDTMDLARLVSRARRSLRYGGWSQLWRSDRLPFSKRKGEMLVVIGANLGNLPAQISARLPSAWNTLYWVARLDRPVAEQLVQQGRIHPGLTLHEAKALFAENRPEGVRKSSHSEVKQRVTRFISYVRRNVEKWSQEERQFTSEKLVRLVEAIETRPLNPHAIESSNTISSSELPMSKRPSKRRALDQFLPVSTETHSQP